MYQNQCLDNDNEIVESFGSYICFALDKSSPERAKVSAPLSKHTFSTSASKRFFSISRIFDFAIQRGSHELSHELSNELSHELSHELLHELSHELSDELS